MVKIKCERLDCKEEATTVLFWEEHKAGSGYWFRYLCKGHRDHYLSEEYLDWYHSAYKDARIYEDHEFFKKMEKYFERDKEHFRKKGMLLEE